MMMKLMAKYQQNLINRSSVVACTQKQNSLRISNGQKHWKIQNFCMQSSRMWKDVLKIVKSHSTHENSFGRETLSLQHMWSVFQTIWKPFQAFERT
jgi:hypothetical protein